jgi:biopolymer transport protein ExbB/TolQ
MSKIENYKDGDENSANEFIDILQRKNLKTSVPLLFAVLGTCVVYYALVPVLKSIDRPAVAYIVEVLVNRGFIQYFTVFFFWLVVGKLLFTQLLLNHESSSFLTISGNYKVPDGKTWSDASDLISLLEKSVSGKMKFMKSIIFKRLKEGMQRMNNTQDTNALVEYFKLRSEIDYSEMESGFSEVKYYNWLIPTLGFVGTVLGIGVGIKGFADMVTKAESFAQVKGYLPYVTYNLGVAFDTTLLALILSAVGIFYANLLSRKHGELLEKIDNYCLDNISSKFKLYTTLADQLQSVFSNINKEITRTLGVNSNEIIKTINENLGVFRQAFTSMTNQLKAPLDNIPPILSLVANKIPDLSPLSVIHDDLSEVKVNLKLFASEQNRIVSAFEQQSDQMVNKDDILVNFKDLLAQMESISLRLISIDGKLNSSNQN